MIRLPRVRIARLAGVLGALFLASAAHAQPELPEAAAVPGGGVILDVGPTSDPAPEVRYNDHRVMLLADTERWRAIIGIPVSVEPGKQLVRIRRGDLQGSYR